jgi:anti-anti-sigma factor
MLVSKQTSTRGTGMADRGYRYLRCHVEDCVLVLAVAEAQLRSMQFDIGEVLRDEMLRAVGEAKATKVVVDLSEVEQFGSASFRPLLSLRRHLNERKGQLLLCGLRPYVREVFLVTRLIDEEGSSEATFGVADSVASAVAKLKK